MNGCIRSRKRRLALERPTFFGCEISTFTRCLLLLQRLPRFIEPPRIFDCDRCLVGEGFEQLNFNSCEPVHIHRCSGQACAIVEAMGRVSSNRDSDTVAAYTR